MAGSATLTTVPSSNAIPEPRTVAAISQRARGDDNGSRPWSTAPLHSRSDEMVCVACTLQRILPHRCGVVVNPGLSARSASD